MKHDLEMFMHDTAREFMDKFAPDRQTEPLSLDEWLVEYAKELPMSVWLAGNQLLGIFEQMEGRWTEE